MPLMLIGCGSLSDATRSMVGRNEQKGPDGMQVRGGGTPCYKAGALIPVGYTTYTITEVTKTYEPFLDLNDGRETSNVAVTLDTSPAGIQLQQQQAMLAVMGLQGQASASFEAGNRSERPSGAYGAARAYDIVSGSKLTVDRENLVQRVDHGGQANVAFIREIVEVSEPKDEVLLEPFGKVLSVATNAEGEMTGQTREPVYTVTIPVKERLIALVTDAKTGKELSRAVYATWSKNVKFYQGQDKKFFADEEMAVAVYNAEKEQFRARLEKGSLFESQGKKVPKHLKELPVTNLTIMSPEDAWGVYFATSLQPYFALPSSDDKSSPAFVGLGTWFDQGDIGWSLKDTYKRDPAWLIEASEKMQAVLDDSTTSTMARACAHLNLAGFAFCRLHAPEAVKHVAAAQQTHPGILEEKNSMLRGGMMDYGSDFYVARHLWLHIDTDINGIAKWRKNGKNAGTIEAPSH
jgi:hypothetical protein